MSITARHLHSEIQTLTNALEIHVNLATASMSLAATDVTAFPATAADTARTVKNLLEVPALLWTTFQHRFASDNGKGCLPKDEDFFYVNLTQKSSFVLMKTAKSFSEQLKRCQEIAAHCPGAVGHMAWIQDQKTEVALEALLVSCMAGWHPTLAPADPKCTFSLSGRKWPERGLYRPHLQRGRIGLGAGVDVPCVQQDHCGLQASELGYKVGLRVPDTTWKFSCMAGPDRAQ